MSGGAGRRGKSAAPLNYGYVGAQNGDEVLDKEAANKEFKFNFFSFAGTRSASLTYRDIIFAFVMEMIASMLITMGVGLGAWFQGTNGILNALMIAAFYGVSYYVATRLPAGDALPRHGHGGLTAASFFTRDIGVWGFLLYTSAQYIGCMTAGGLFLSYLLQGVTASATQSLIPIPVTSGPYPTSLTTVIMLELVFSATFVTVVLLKHYLNTETTGEKNANGQNAKNARKAGKLGALTIFWLVLVGYSFGVFTFNNVAYLGPLFGGVQGVPDLDLKRQIGHQVNLYSADYTDSVFGTTGAAAALYLLMPYAGGLLGVGLFWLVSMAGFAEGTSRILPSAQSYYTTGPNKEFFHSPVTGPNPASSPSASNVGLGLRSPLNPQGSAQ